MATSESPSTLYAISDRLQRAMHLLMLGGFALATIWLLVGLAAAAWLAWWAPLTAQDLSQASWLGSPFVVRQGSTGPLAWLMGLALVTAGLLGAVVNKTLVTTSMVTVAAAAVLGGAGEGTAVRIGVLDDTVKIGCFVETSKECLEMLGLPVGEAESRYNHAQGDAPWYLASRQAAVTHQQELRALVLSFPGGALLRAPMYFGSADELSTRLTAQRAAVRARQAASGPTP